MVGFQVGGTVIGKRGSYDTVSTAQPVGRMSQGTPPAPDGEVGVTTRDANRASKSARSKEMDHANARNGAARCNRMSAT
jgi:hypothetical protein